VTSIALACHFQWSARIFRRTLEEQVMAENALIHAASTGDLEGVQEVLRQQTPEINSSTLLEALNRATLNGHLEVVKFLLENGADVHGRGGNGNTPLHCAIRGYLAGQRISRSGLRGEGTPGEERPSDHLRSNPEEAKSDSNEFGAVSE